MGVLLFVGVGVRGLVDDAVCVGVGEVSVPPIVLVGVIV